VVALPAVLITLLSVMVGGVSLVVRFRRARGVERQQLRWVASAAVVAAAGIPLAMAGISIDSAAVVGAAVLASAAVLFLAIAAAILRYRLYDLDRIISRTLAYGLLTLLLGLGYAAVVLGLGRLLPEGSSLVVAAATLAMAAVFQPARRRIQQQVDRRFNRRRHDAGQMIAAFGARLRHHVDLDDLTDELLTVVDQTMQPTRASLWLRPQAPANTRQTYHPGARSPWSRHAVRSRSGALPHRWCQRTRPWSSWGRLRGPFCHRVHTADHRSAPPIAGPSPMVSCAPRP
jgi:hypothetical protein